MSGVLPDAMEILRMAGRHEPPVKVAPILDALGVAWQFDQHRPFPHFDGVTVFVPAGSRAKQPGMNVTIAHEIPHALLRIPGGSYDAGDRPALRVREAGFDAYARSLVMPEEWFRQDAHRLRGVGCAKRLAERYEVPVGHPITGVITRAIELGLASTVCRDKDSYAEYLKHPYWSGTDWMGGPGRRIAYLTTHRWCEHSKCRNRAMIVHHLPAGYRFLGQERDDHLRAVCKPHHDAQHTELDQMALFD